MEQTAITKLLWEADTKLSDLFSDREKENDSKNLILLVDRNINLRSHSDALLEKDKHYQEMVRDIDRYCLQVLPADADRDAKRSFAVYNLLKSILRECLGMNDVFERKINIERVYNWYREKRKRMLEFRASSSLSKKNIDGMAAHTSPGFKIAIPLHTSDLHDQNMAPASAPAHTASALKPSGLAGAAAAASSKPPRPMSATFAPDVEDNSGKTGMHLLQLQQQQMLPLSARTDASTSSSTQLSSYRKRNLAATFMVREAMRATAQQAAGAPLVKTEEHQAAVAAASAVLTARSSLAGQSDATLGSGAPRRASHSGVTGTNRSFGIGGSGGESTRKQLLSVFVGPAAGAPSQLDSSRSTVPTSRSIFVGASEKDEQLSQAMSSLWLEKRAADTERGMEEEEFAEVVQAWSTHRSRVEEEVSRRIESLSGQRIVFGQRLLKAKKDQQQDQEKKPSGFKSPHWATRRIPSFPGVELPKEEISHGRPGTGGGSRPSSASGRPSSAKSAASGKGGKKKAPAGKKKKDSGGDSEAGGSGNGAPPVPPQIYFVQPPSEYRLQQMDECDTIKQTLAKHNVQINGTTLERALLLPEDRPHEFCVSYLPVPGCGLFRDPFGADDGGGKKKGAKKAGGKKKGKKK